MSRHARPLFTFLALTFVILACAVPIPPVGQPTPNNGTAIPPAPPDPNNLGTAVAQTLTALAPEPTIDSSADSPTATAPTTEETTDVLSRTLYYIAPDDAGIPQLFRLGPNDTTQLQITSESDSVSDYDVSPVDGSVAYIANNQLRYANADGSERRVLVDGGDVDPNNPFISTISSPVFSLDGRALAYGFKGLQFYSFATGESQLAIENQIDDVGNGQYVPRELYQPERYSPDGTKLLITLAYYEGASSAIYDPDTDALVRLEGGEGALLCCEEVEWSADSASIYSASATAGMFSPGLWRVDAATGEVTTLIPGEEGDGTFNAAKEAYLAPDGQLYFFFGTASSPEEIFARPSLQLVRSAPDGVTGRTVLSSEEFQLLNEALWAPDASLVVAVVAPAPEIYQGGQAKVIYLDGRTSMNLAPFAQQMKWGP